MGASRRDDRPAQAGLTPVIAPGRLRKRSVTLAGHRTSLSVEQVFWDELKRLAAEEGLSLQALIARLDRERVAEGKTTIGLSGAIRVYVVRRLREKLARATQPAEE